MRADLVPALDPSPVPGPPALLVVLWIVTFLLHLFCVNAAMGGALFATLLPLRLSGEPRRAVSLFFVNANSWALSLAITFAIAPLLFLQVLDGRYFYTASILVAPVWLGLLLLLMLAYYLNWLAKFRLRDGKSAAGLLAVTAALYLVIAGIQTAVHLLSVQPGLWGSFLARPALVLADPTFPPRFLHFVLAAVAMAAILPAAWPRPLGDAAPEAARFGLRVSLAATLLQFVAGLWLLGALPRPVLTALVTGGLATLAPLGLGALAGIAILMILVKAAAAPGDVRLARFALGAFAAAALFMIVTRHQVRDLYLAASGAAERMEVAPQWGVLALFLLVFVVCAGLTVWAVVRAVRDRPGPGEAAA
ncbi:MAG TPA: hypothetical protein VMN04_12515 [Thermoanaerobaculia bacterium]|nr:hypothetical protein [Thermoanaerobaculia bacterium]